MCSTRTSLRLLALAALFSTAHWPAAARAQDPAQPAQPAQPEAPVPPAEQTPPVPATPETAPATPPGSPDSPQGADQPAAGLGGLRLHFITTRNTYSDVAYDIFDVKTRAVVASGRGALENRGEVPPSVDLAPGLYRIVKAGEPFSSKTDFATVQVEPGVVTDFVIVVDPDGNQFRGSGPLVEELPEGVEVAGVRLNLNAGGSLLFNQKEAVVGHTSGNTAILGLFSNFGVVLDRGNHFFGLVSRIRGSSVAPEGLQDCDTGRFRRLCSCDGRSHV
jgi:hypothetical protein